jgi:hypothetical protein
MAKRQVTTFKLSIHARQAIKDLKAMGYSSADAIFADLVFSPARQLLSLGLISWQNTRSDGIVATPINCQDSLLDRVEISEDAPPGDVSRTKHGINQSTLLTLNEISKRRQCSRDDLLEAGILKLWATKKEAYRMITDVARIAKRVSDTLTKAEAELNKLGDKYKGYEEEIAEIIDSYRVATNSYERFTSDLNGLSDMAIDDWPLDELGR